MSLTKFQIAQRISQELKDGYYVNLGIGIPTLIANYIPDNISVVLQSENGLLGMGPFPEKINVDPDLINAGKETITTLKGSALFSSAESFAMIRGGHIDFCVLGAMEVSIKGDLANWSTGKGIPAVGGAMDLVAGAKNVFVMTQHLTKEGSPKLVKKCSLPLTGASVVSRVYSDYAILDITKEGFKVLELNEDISLEYLQTVTDGKVYQ